MGGAAHLARAAGGSLGHSGRVGHVVSQVEVGSSADQVAVIEGGGEDFCVGAQQGALPPSLTLNPATVNVPAKQQKQEVMFLQDRY